MQVWTVAGVLYARKVRELEGRERGKPGRHRFGQENQQTKKSGPKKRDAEDGQGGPRNKRARQARQGGTTGQGMNRAANQKRGHGELDEDKQEAGGGTSGQAGASVKKGIHGRPHVPRHICEEHVGRGAVLA